MTRKSQMVDDEKFIENLYKDLLGREPDKNGLEHFRDALQSGRVTRDQVRISIISSPEYLQKHIETAQPPYFEDDAAVVRHYEEEDIPLPPFLLIETTSRCNLRCAMCSRTWGKSPSGDDYADMPIDFFSRIVEETASHVRMINPSGFGEPLLHKNFAEMVQIVKSHDITFAITSNGNYLPKETLETIIDNAVDSITFSIDAATSETYEHIRAGGDLNRVIENIRRIQEAKRAAYSDYPGLFIAFIVMRSNIHELPRLMRLAGDLGILGVTLQSMDDYGIGARETLWDHQHEAQKYLEEAEETAQEIGVPMSYNFKERLWAEVGRLPKETALLQLPTSSSADNAYRKRCVDPWVHAFITHEGDVRPCCISSDSMGNLHNASFETIWRGEKFRDFRRRLRSDAPPEVCRDCQQRAWHRAKPLTWICDSIILPSEQLGLGWGETSQIENRHYRAVNAPTATIFLRNSHKRYIAITHRALAQERSSSRVLVDGQEIGKINGAARWQTSVFAMPSSDNDIITVTLEMENQHRKSKLAIHRVEFTDKRPKRDNVVSNLISELKRIH